jgi:hypothetical protein
MLVRMSDNNEAKYEESRRALDENRISKTLDFLAEKGIDGIRIKLPKIYGACYLPIPMTEDGIFFLRDIVGRCEGKYRTGDLMDIDVFNLIGMRIKK